MRLNKKSDIELFMKTVRECKGDVYLVSAEGDKINLKSELSLYIGVGELIKEIGDQLELWCSKKEDEGKMIGFLVELNKED